MVLFAISVALILAIWSVNSTSSPSTQMINSSKDDATSKETTCSKGDQIFYPTAKDRFTGLPDDTLSCILSFLSLRDVVRMTTLSRSWRNVLSCLTCLDLDWHAITGRGPIIHRECESFRKGYLKTVHHVLGRYQNVEISSFRLLFCYVKENAAVVDGWLKFAAKKHLRCLVLHFWCGNNIYPPSLPKGHEPYVILGSFFSHFPYLNDLRLGGCVLKHDGELLFNGLVRLDLNYVILEGTQWQPLISNFSTIEWLSLRTCKLPYKLYIDNNLRRLSFLIIKDCPDLKEIVLGAKNLKTFELDGEVAPICSFVSVSKMENVFITLGLGENNGKALLSSLANSTSGLKTLYLHEQYLMLHRLPKFPDALFHSVLELNLSMVQTGVKYEWDLGVGTDFPHLLKTFPLLQKLFLTLPCFGYVRWQEPAVVLHSHLKYIQLAEFEGRWIPLAHYMLRCATALDRLVMKNGFRDYFGDGEWKSGPLPGWIPVETRAALEGHAISPTVELIICD